jgi:chorismate mutase
MTIKQIRSEIEEIDQQIIMLIAKRISLLPKIIDYKKQQHLNIFQPEREKQLFQKYWCLARERHLNPEFVRKLFELIIEESRNQQEDLLDEE